MTFVLTDTKEKEFTVQNALSFELIDDANASCKGLRLYFENDCEIGEIVFVKVKNGGAVIFSGICDLQKESRLQSGFEYFIFARSLESILIDNEAEPFEYKNPTAKQLFISNARQFGFECALPDIFIEADYIVSKGTSCFGAINDFVKMASGSSVYIDENGVMQIYSESKECKFLSDYNVILQELIISRSSVISRVDYKINASDGYKYHYSEDVSGKRKIQRTRKINLSGMPLWQREKAVEKKIADSLLNYRSLKVKLFGICDFNLYDRLVTDKGEFIISEIVYTKNENGEFTTVVMKQKYDGKIVNYVA